MLELAELLVRLHELGFQRVVLLLQLLHLLPLGVELRLGDLPLLGVRHGAEELVELLQEQARHLLLVRPGEVPGEVRGEDREGRKGFEPMFF